MDGNGVPLSIVVSGANVHDVKLLEPTLDALVIKKPEPGTAEPPHLCADAGYKGEKAKRAVKARNDQPHIKQRREEGVEQQAGCKPRRWVVERTHSWFNAYRKILISFEKLTASYLALLSLAAGLICWR